MAASQKKDRATLPRVTVFQPALPAFRLDFFDRVARELGPGFAVYYPPAKMDVLTDWPIDDHPWARPVGAMKPLFSGAEWHSGLFSQPLRRGDIVVIPGAPRTLSYMAMLIWARLKGVRTVWFGHYWSATSKTHRHFVRMLYMGFSQSILFYTDQEVDEYRSQRGPDRRPISALNNGINVEPIAALREAYDARSRPRSILFIGRLTPKANLPLLLRALADRRLASVRLEVIGGADLANELRTLARDLGVDGRVAWHPGTTDESAIAAIANGCRLFVYPGQVGLSIIHAMAYGLPSVVHDDRWRHMPEIAAFTDNVTGRSFRQGDPVSLAETLAMAIDDVDALSRWSKEAVRRADTVYNTKAMAERFTALIRQVRLEPR